VSTPTTNGAPHERRPSVSIARSRSVRQARRGAAAFATTPCTATLNCPTPSPPRHTVGRATPGVWSCLLRHPPQWLPGAASCWFVARSSTTTRTRRSVARGDG
jgi:hypothetical protein